jgi:hypothetical protein
MSAESAFIDGGTTQDERSVVHGTALSMTRRVS